MKRIFCYFLLVCSVVSAKRVDNLENVFCQRWGWMSICDFAYANNFDSGVKVLKNDTPFNPVDVFPGAVIFVTGHSINDFFEKINPQIKNPYILVVMFGGVLRKHLDDSNVIACFANDAGSIQYHPKFTMIPIGLFRDERLFHERKKMHELFLQLRKKPKNKLVYMNFTRHHWSSERRAIYDMLQDKAFVCIGSPKPFTNYMQEMSDFKFTISPQGDMWDCYRHWEAIMGGSIPIVPRSCINQLFVGLPVLIIDDWREVTEEFLNEKYDEITNKEYDLKKLYLPYWVEKINEARDRYLES